MTPGARGAAINLDDTRVVDMPERGCWRERAESAERARAGRTGPARTGDSESAYPQMSAKAEARLDGVVSFAIGRRARVTEPERVIRVVGSTRLAHQDLEHRAEGVELGRATAAGSRKRARREAWKQPEAHTGRERAKGGIPGALRWNSGSEVISRSSAVNCIRYGKPSPAITYTRWVCITSFERPVVPDVGIITATSPWIERRRPATVGRRGEELLNVDDRGAGGRRRRCAARRR